MANKTEKPAEAQNQPAAQPSSDKKLKNVRYRQTMPSMPSRPKDTEAQTRKIVLWGSLITLLLVVLLIGAALLQMFVLEPNRAVASVGGQNITVSQLQKAMRMNLNSSYNQYSNMQNAVVQLQQQSQSDQTSGFLLQLYQQQMQQVAAQISNDAVASNSLDTLINDQLIRQEAKKRGITVSADEVQKEMESDFGYYAVPLTPYPTYTPAPAVNGTPVPTTEPQAQPTSVSQADYQTKYESAVKYFDGVGLGVAGLRDSYEVKLLGQKLQTELGKDVPTTAQHYLFDYLRFDAEADAQKALAQLSSGASFSNVISATNAITQPAVIGSGASQETWMSKFEVGSQYGEDVLPALDAATINKPTGIVTSTLGGFHIFLVKGREVRPLNASELQTQQQKPFTDWITKAQSDTAIVNRIEAPTKFLPAEVKTFIKNFQAQTQ